jgi:CMP-N,N'-diacetyllegionaminic acid synthase
MTYLALIPARAGSKGIPQKNLKPLAGKPLIAWSIEQAKSAKGIGRVVLSTDGADIAAEARKWGAEVPFVRPAEISTDSASTELAMIHAVEALGKDGYRPDFVVLLQPTSPIRRKGAIDAAIRLLEENNADSLVSTREIHPFLWKNPQNAQAGYDVQRRPRRQDVPDDERLYEENGSIYITRTDVLMRDHCRLGGKIVAFAMSSAESIDIDTAEDFALAGALMESIAHS